jgi:carbon storage regulator
MLVLTRKVGEGILIGDNIEITLVRIEGDQVRIGIAAPKEVFVCRKELIEQVQQENVQAAQAVRDGDEQMFAKIAEATGQKPLPSKGLTLPSVKRKIGNNKEHKKP